MPSVLSIDSRSSRELRAVILAVNGAERTIQASIRKQTQTMAQPEWQKALATKAATPLQDRFLAQTGRTRVDNRGVTLVSGGLSKKASGGLTTDDSRVVEFGANRNAVTTYRARSRKGKSFSVTRHTQRQLSWANRKGLVVYPAATPLVGRFVSLWVQTTVRVLHRAFEGKEA